MKKAKKSCDTCKFQEVNGEKGCYAVEHCAGFTAWQAKDDNTDKKGLTAFDAMKQSETEEIYDIERGHNHKIIRNEFHFNHVLCHCFTERHTYTLAELGDKRWLPVSKENPQPRFSDTMIMKPEDLNEDDYYYIVNHSGIPVARGTRRIIRVLGKTGRGLNYIHMDGGKERDGDTFAGLGLRALSSGEWCATHYHLEKLDRIIHSEHQILSADEIDPEKMYKLHYRKLGASERTWSIRTGEEWLTYREPYGLGIEPNAEGEYDRSWLEPAPETPEKPHKCTCNAAKFVEGVKAGIDEEKAAAPVIIFWEDFRELAKLALEDKKDALIFTFADEPESKVGRRAKAKLIVGHDGFFSHITRTMTGTITMELEDEDGYVVKFDNDKSRIVDAKDVTFMEEGE